MIINYIFTFIFSVLAYVFISYFGQLTGGISNTFLNTVYSVFRPVPFVVLVIGNIFWGLAAYYGFQNTRYAITMIITFGLITSFVYSIYFLGANFSYVKLVGLLLILTGVYFIK